MSSSLLMAWLRVLQLKRRCKCCGSSIGFMWQLWYHNQHKKDWGGISPSTWKVLQGACHHIERTTIASDRQVHLPWKHSYAHWWWSQCQDCQSWCNIWPTMWKYLEKVGSDLAQSWKFTDLWCCQHYYTRVKLGQFTNGMPKNWTTSIQAVRELLKIKWQERIPDTEVLKRVKLQSVHSLLKFAQLRR